jgi:hypothetical protein
MTNIPPSASAPEPASELPPEPTPEPVPEPPESAPNPPSGLAQPQAQIPVHPLQFKQLLMIAGVATVPLLAFGYLVTAQGLLDFPAVGANPSRGDEARYFQDALDYRERRMALALVLRTFITSFAFVVGLALCTQGGLFILRQVTAFTTLQLGGGGQTTETAGTPTPAAVPLFSFSSYSPGVAFLLGGVGLMVATQYLAIPVRMVEIVPPSALQLCLNSETNQWENCLLPAQSKRTVKTVSTPADADVCKQANPPSYCEK